MSERLLKQRFFLSAWILAVAAVALASIFLGGFEGRAFLLMPIAGAVLGVIAALVLELNRKRHFKSATMQMTGDLLASQLEKEQSQTYNGIPIIIHWTDKNSMLVVETQDIASQRSLSTQVVSS